MNYTNIVTGADGIIIYKDKILLQKRSINAGAYPRALSIPGGNIERNEDPVKALIREIQEETGINISKEKIRLIAFVKQYHLDRDRLFLGYTFKIELKKFAIPISSDEGEVEWINISELKDRKDLVPNQYKLLNSLNFKDDEIVFSTYEMKNWDIHKILSETTV